jgi:hypothetical protein
MKAEAGCRKMPLASRNHTGIEFIAWSLPEQSLQFRLSGTSEDKAKLHLDMRLVYHLDSHQVTQ